MPEHPEDIADRMVALIEEETRSLNDEDYIETLQVICSQLEASVQAKQDELR